MSLPSGALERPGTDYSTIFSSLFCSICLLLSQWPECSKREVPGLPHRASPMVWVCEEQSPLPLSPMEMLLPAHPGWAACPLKQMLLFLAPKSLFLDYFNLYFPGRVACVPLESQADMHVHGDVLISPGEAHRLCYLGDSSLGNSPCT